jgi:hypothetical protein
MSLIFTRTFGPGETVALYRPLATPNVGLGASVDTGTADSNGSVVFALDATEGAHYVAVAASGRRAWRLVTGPAVVNDDYLPGSPGYSSHPFSAAADGVIPSNWNV